MMRDEKDDDDDDNYLQYIYIYILYIYIYIYIIGSSHPEICGHSQGRCAVICNLTQNPNKRSVVNWLCPTLLKQEIMFLAKNPDFASDVEERPLTGKDCLETHTHSTHTDNIDTSSK